MKFMGGLNKIEIPTNLRALQSLVGKLMYAAPHVPHFKRRVHVIE